MEQDLTDLSGIGKKTAEKLREDGIDDPDELAAARRRDTEPRVHKDEMSLIRWGVDPNPDDGFPGGDR